MTLSKTEQDFVKAIQPAVSISDSGLKVTDVSRLKNEIIDTIVYNVALNPDPRIKSFAIWVAWQLAQASRIYPASIHALYEARGKGEFKGFTVPAVNIRGLTYDIARALIRTGMKNNAPAFIFEIARSEIGYTFQRPAEYVAVILSAAIKEGLRGPLFIQGDHFQVNQKRYAKDPKAEVDGVKALIKEAIDGGFYNIDIDTSTLVDLDKEAIEEQQRLNFETAAELTSFIRNFEPEGVTISVGGEIGEVGGKNSTVEELRAFMDGYKKALEACGKGLKGINKISVQTGTSHGGVVLPDGSVAEVQLDFATLERLSKVGSKEYGLSGAVQHGASTLPDEAFHKFVETETSEVHLATGFQNMIYESKHFPRELREKMYAWLKQECAAERKEGQTEDQFIYKTRKKAFGPFKKELIDLPSEVRDALAREVEEKFDFLFKKLSVVNTQKLADKYIRIKEVRKEKP